MKLSPRYTKDPAAPARRGPAGRDGLARRLARLLVPAALLCAPFAATPPAVIVAPQSAWAQQDQWWLPRALRSRDDERERERRRAQRELIRDALISRLEPEFRTTTPYVSAETIAALEKVIGRYRAIVERGGWPKVPEDRTLRVNDSGEAVRALRHRLMITGDLASRSRRDWRFDSDAELAVARFQKRHGLEVTGFVDTRTRRALNVPAHERLQQLKVNLARVRELMKITESGRYVLVNVPAYQLQAVERNRLAIQSNVVVGQPERETPSVSTHIKELNFYPYWRVPDSIARRDLIPQIRKDPSYFHEEHFSLLKTWGAEPVDPATVDWHSPEIRNYKFRQDPGKHNALGVLRLNMPNKHTVYLHDTPLKQLFARPARAFSSGCVRVERVLDLASWLLEKNGEWDSRRVRETVARGESKDVALKKPVPVHFVYVSAWATPNGMPHFRPDIYRRDGVAVAVAENREDGAAGGPSVTP